MLVIKNFLNSIFKKFKNNIYFSYLDAQLILAYILNKKYIWILINENDYFLNIKQIKLFLYLNKQKLLGKPIQYIIKKCYFYNIILNINSNVFIPRIETELLIEITLKKIKEIVIKNNKIKLLELGTGSGAISIAIAKKYSNCNILAIDYKLNIIKIAKYNANKYFLKNIKFKVSNWFKNITFQYFNIIISNPPYIDINDVYYTYTNIKFEPKKSLISKFNGYNDLIKIINISYKWLFYKGWIILEHAWYQSKFLKKYLKYKKFKNINIIKDIFGNNRIICAQKLS